MEDHIKETFHDAIGFARAVSIKDWAGAQVLWDLHPQKLDIAMPLSTIISSLLHRLQEDFGVDKEAAWTYIVQAVDEMETNNEADEEGEQ